MKGVRVCVLDEADRLFETSLIREPLTSVAIFLCSLTVCLPIDEVQEILAAMSSQDEIKIVRTTRKSRAGKLYGSGWNSTNESERAVKKKPFRQMILVSATMPKELADFAAADVQDHILIRLDTDTLMSESLKVGYFYVLDYEKLPGLAFLLSNILDTTGNTTLPSIQDLIMNPHPLTPWGASNVHKLQDQKFKKRCLIFCATRHSVELITQVLGHAGFQVGGLHGHADNEQRKILVEDFAMKRLQVAW